MTDPYHITAENLIKQDLRFVIASAVTGSGKGRKRLYVCCSPLGFSVTLRVVIPDTRHDETLMWFGQSLYDAVEAYENLG